MKRGGRWMTIRLPDNLDTHVRSIARDRMQSLSEFVRSVLWEEVRRKRKVCDKCTGAGVVNLRQNGGE